MRAWIILDEAKSLCQTADKERGWRSMVSSFLATLLLLVPIIATLLFLLWKHFLVITILALCLYLLFMHRRRCGR